MDGLKNLIPKLYERYIRPNATYLWGIGIALTVFLLLRALYFGENPLFGYHYLVETVIASAIFLIVYFYGKAIVGLIGSGIENAVLRTVNRAFSEVWRLYSGRLIDMLRREANTPIVEISEIHYPEGSVVLDTSTIIDGRILGVIENGFLDCTIIVPQNVIDELQHMADKSNDLKRQKGRRGLDMLKTIRKLLGKSKFIVVDIKTSPKDVDKSLVEFCKKHRSKIATVDFNLNKVAQVSGVRVLNINQLANDIKTNLLPGEVLHIKLVQIGKEQDQAVGYLEDGTMIVIKNAAAFVGEDREVIVEKVLQTSAGRMIFANIQN